MPVMSQKHLQNWNGNEMSPWMVEMQFSPIVPTAGAGAKNCSIIDLSETNTKI